jgi:hypothetical protein
MKERPDLMTVGDLKRHLSVFSDDYRIDFSGLDFYRLKRRGDLLVQVEFNQQVYRDKRGLVIIENFVEQDPNQ